MKSAQQAGPEKSRWRIAEQSYVDAIAHPLAGSQRIVIPLLLLLGLGSISRSFDEGGRVILFAAGFQVVALIAAWAWYSLASLIIRFTLPRNRSARGWLFAATYGTTEMTRSLLYAWLRAQGNVGPEPNWAFETVAGFMTGLALFGVVSLLVGDAYTYKADLGNLLNIQEKLRVAALAAKRDLQARREELLSGVREILDGALGQVLGADAEARGSRETVVLLNAVARDVVRPLSHELFGTAKSDSLLEMEQSVPRIRVSEVAALATVTKPFRPIAMVVMIFLLFSGFAFFVMPPLWGGITLTSVCLGTYIFLALCQEFVVPWLRRRNLGIRYLALTLIYALFTILFWTSMTSLTGWSNQGPALAQALYSLVLGVPLLSLFAATPALRLARQQTLAEARRLNERLNWLAARLNAELWSDRRALAKTLHQDVQGVLVAAAFRLQRAIDDDRDVDLARLEVRELVEMAANFAVAPTTPPTMDFAIENLSDRWRGVLEISFSSDASAQAALSADPIARQILQDAVSEFVTNAVKHGLAKTATIYAKFDGEANLIVEGRNDGSPISEDSFSPGMGTRMMQTMGVRGGYENVPGGVVFRAKLPVVIDESDGQI